MISVVSIAITHSNHLSCYISDHPLLRPGVQISRRYLQTTKDNPTVLRLFARHLVGNMVTQAAHLLITVSTTQLFQVQYCTFHGQIAFLNLDVLPKYWKTRRWWRLIAFPSWKLEEINHLLSTRVQASPQNISNKMYNYSNTAIQQVSPIPKHQWRNFN